MSEESIMYSLRNLRTRKGRSILTILSIFIGITAIFIFISFGLGLFSYVNELSSGSAADKIIVQPKGNDPTGLDDTFRLTQNDLEAVEGVAGVISVTGVSIGTAELERRDQKRFAYISGYDPKQPIIFDISDIELEAGRYLETGDTGKVILGYNYQVPDKIFSEPLEIGDTIQLQGEDARVIGFMEAIGNPTDDANVYITKAYYEELYPTTVDTYSWIIAQVDIDRIDLIVEEVEEEVRESRGLEEGKEDFFVQSFEDLIESFSGALNLIIGFVILIALISVVVSAVNTANTMITSVLERTKEIGIIKSIGAPNSEILKIFLFESATLGFVAGVIGLVIGFGATTLAGNILDSLGWGFLQPQYTWWLFAGLLGFATLTGALSGIIPAIRASKINPVDALRYE